MPVYEYLCEDCHGKFEARVGNWRDADNQSCRLCEGSNVHRTISTFAFVGAGSNELPMSAAPSTGGGGCCGGSCGCHHG